MKTFPLYCFLLLLLVYETDAQKGLPPFVNRRVVLAIPAFLPGIMDDSNVLRNDTLLYHLEGQLFGKGYKVGYNRAFINFNTPWHTLFTLANAYANKNKNLIIALYASNTKERIRNFLSGQNAAGFLNEVSKATKSNLRILGGFNYKKGYMIYTKDDSLGIHENYIIKERGQYKLSALNDSSALGWNIALYFKFNPQPMIPVNNLLFPDSLRLNDSIRLTVNITENNRWLALFYGTRGNPVALLVEDNGPLDLDKQERRISFYLKGKTFASPGTYTFYTSLFNFPVLRISQNFLNEQARRTIKIY